MTGETADPDATGDPELLLRDTALETSTSILVMQRRAEDELKEAKKALEARSEELAHSLSLLNATLESTPYGFVAVDLAGRIVTWNSRFEAMWHFPPDVLGSRDNRAWRTHASTQMKDPEAFLRRSELLLTEPEAEQFDIVELKDGRTFERHAFPQRVGGECVGTVVNWRDITERRRLEADLRHSQKMEAVGTLAAGIAHDFNNLLTAIIGYTELAESTLPPNAPEHDDLAQIRSAGERAAKLTRQLLTFARRQHMDARSVHLGGVVLQLDRLLRRLLGEHIEIVTHVADDLWSLRADAGQMEQIVMNLAINARDAMPSGGRLGLSVQNACIEPGGDSYQTVPPGEYVVLTVSDTGVGMTPEVLEHAFDPFYTTKDPGRGTGLGLATVYGIVQQHGGHILAESAPETGTTFEILFPRAGVTPADPPPAAAPDSDRTGHTILLVEDDVMVRRLTTRTLQHLGYGVIESEAPADAIAVAADPTQRIDLLLSDVMMPLMSGTEVAARSRGIRPTLPVLLMSGYTEQSVGDLVGRKHGYRFLSKPFTSAQLNEQVRAALEAPDTAGTADAVTPA